MVKLRLTLFMRLSNNYSGVQSINNVYANVNKVQNPFIDALIFDLIDNGVYVVYALYSSIEKTSFRDTPSYKFFFTIFFKIKIIIRGDNFNPK
jgi:hypothetical protein